MRAALALVVMLAVAGLSYLALRGDSLDRPTEGPSVGHVHGLGVDPADGTLYAATHHGLLRLPEGGPASLVADRVQDFMGFTVAGPERFLASGHPAEGQGGPHAVGLIESTDAGLTWTTRSLGGQADFHALEFRHGRVYGLDVITGTLMVSENLTDWTSHDTVPMADFAVSPQDPDVLLATTERGLARSTDGGATFAVVWAGPPLLLVGWAEDGSVAGVTAGGTVFTAADPDGSWVERGSVDGPPEAFLAESALELYAASRGRILSSTDRGETFKPRS